jgi:hypothetical protein
MRPLWGPLPGATQELLVLERAALDGIDTSRAVAIAIAPEAERIGPIVQACRLDIIAGTELARAGYLKQACALWRSWCEQALFGLYFFEAPLHRLAWRGAPEIDPGRPPVLRLMLHEMLISSGDRAHPFALVYSDRCKTLLDLLRIGIPQANQPMKILNHRFSDLSQAVHGTYRPVPPASEADAPGALGTQLVSIFEATVTIVGLLWFVGIQAQLDLVPDRLIAMRDEGFVAASPEEEMLLRLLPQLKRYLTFVKAK